MNRVFRTALAGALVAAAACHSTVAPDSAPPGAHPEGGAEAAGTKESGKPGKPAVATPVIPAEVAAQESGAPAIDASAALEDPTTGKLRHAALLKRVYAERSGDAFLASADQVLTAAGAAVIEAIGAAEAHALDPARYHVDQVRALRKEVATRVAAIEQEGLVKVDPGERAALTALGSAERDQTGTLPEGGELLRRALAQGAAGPLPRTVAAVQARAAALEDIANAAARLEVLLADAMVTWASDMRLGYTAKLPEKDVEKRGEEAIVKERLDAFFREAAQDPEKIPSTLAKLPPEMVQYPRLVEALARYRGFCAKGPWPEVAYSGRKPLPKTGSAPVVATLRERLRAEGYDVPVSAHEESYDPALDLVVDEYRATHQMELGVGLDRELAQSLSIPCARRVRQIELTLQRWRESRIVDGTQYHVFVNLPDFHGEVWDQGQLLHRFRVVVGNRARGHNPLDPKSGYKNATPRLAARIQYLEFNPYWNVPDRIRTEELEPEMGKDPDYLRKHGYEMIEEGGREWIRQRPGSGNALGKVKFLFPNPWSVYLHDTNQRKLFDRPTRAYSHGCMRVHEPLKLAELLLTREGKWDPALVSSNAFTPINLDNPIPIYVEYYVVRVDDDGRVHFNLDLYGLDAKRLDG